MPFSICNCRHHVVLAGLRDRQNSSMIPESPVRTIIVLRSVRAFFCNTQCISLHSRLFFASAMRQLFLIILVECLHRWYDAIVEFVWIAQPSGGLVACFRCRSCAVSENAMKFLARIGLRNAALSIHGFRSDASHCKICPNVIEHRLAAFPCRSIAGGDHLSWPFPPLILTLNHPDCAQSASGGCAPSTPAMAFLFFCKPRRRKQKRVLFLPTDDFVWFSPRFTLKVRFRTEIPADMLYGTKIFAAITALHHNRSWPWFPPQCCSF